MKTLTIAEIGINYAYGNKSDFLNNAKKLIDIAFFSGFDFVKFQKRNPDICVPNHQKEKPKKVPWKTEEITYLQYKKDIELNDKDYHELFKYANNKKIGIFASVWDKDSVDFMAKFPMKFYPTGNEKYPFEIKKVMKIPSALITNLELVKYARKKSDILMISTGMSTEKEIEEAVKIGKPDVIFHTNSSYPSPNNELNLRYINHLIKKFGKNAKIGYSGHEYGITSTFTAVTLGAQIIERHITLDRTLWGSDQMASVEPIGQLKLIKGIREIEESLGIEKPRTVLNSELSKRISLRGE